MDSVIYCIVLVIVCQEVVPMSKGLVFWQLQFVNTTSSKHIFNWQSLVESTYVSREHIL